MEEPPSLLCPECGNIYDLKETFPNCDHLYCATCFLVTDDKTCRVCESQKVDHSECSKYREIKHCLTELEYELECEEADFIEKQMKETLESCSKCSKPSELLMLCVNCARIKMKRLETEEWIIQKIEGDVKVSDDVLCVECAASGHGGHEMLEVAEIQNLTDAIKNEFFLEYYHHQKSILQLFSPNIKKHKERADYYYKEMKKRNHEDYFETCSTQLIECYREERNKLTGSMLKVLKLIMRLQTMYIDCLQKHIEHQIVLEETAAKERKKSIEHLLLRLSMTQMKFKKFIKKYRRVQSTPGDIEEIDVELNARMETLEVEYKKGLMLEIELENGSKFYKYQAIMKEAEEIGDLFTSLRTEKPKHEYDLIEKGRECVEIFRANFDDQQGDFKDAIKFNEMEVMQAEIRLDKMWKKKLVEANERFFFMELMKLKFFPITPEADEMDARYNWFFEF